MVSLSRKQTCTLGILGQVLFIVSWLIFGVMQGSNYSWVKHSISDMYAVGAPHGGVLVVLITLCGALTLSFLVWGLWPAVKKAGLPAKVSVVMLALSIYGLGDLLSPFERLGCRLADSGCTEALQSANFGGKADQLLSSLGILLFMLGILTLGYSIKKLKVFSGTSPLLIVGGYIFIPLFIMMGAAPEISGLTERIIAILGASLLTITARSCNITKP